MDKKELFQQVDEAINDWEKERLVEIVTAGLDNGFGAMEIIHEALLPKFDGLFNKLKAWDITFPELLLLADTVQAAINVLLPQVKASLPEEQTKGRIIIGTVAGDIHDIGKSIVAVVLRSGGYDVTDLGRDVPAAEFIEAAVEEKAHIIAASTLMTPTLASMEDLISEIRAQKIGVKTIIGGWATSPEFAQRIGADAWGRDSTDGLRHVESLMLEIARHG
jgi:methylmalonyl-CoA mutase cobalamin-binding domain/chain